MIANTLHPMDVYANIRALWARFGELQSEIASLRTAISVRVHKAQTDKEEARRELLRSNSDSKPSTNADGATDIGKTEHRTPIRPNRSRDGRTLGEKQSTETTKSLTDARGHAAGEQQTTSPK